MVSSEEIREKNNSGVWMDSGFFVSEYFIIGLAKQLVQVFPLIPYGKT